ncbi:MAG: hypothetical protein DRN35_04920 [Thermoplasmata archaeon]|nr:MAG: hypothetical protein DRN28_01615 [Thermoplasmata archaeon]RLF70066.1 MAG: hypothetical protein DRN35_04920 [Thermoplasmata archaeon]RLF73511.1 MAG: hypothetical protein DRN55_03215 [Thermoplasmata archaeon]RLF76271.1 MAG: hypothetical protein DRN42_01355 [Thermoplasmata archaeon]HDD59651.1 DUF3198 domain-containing protein [Euryarchaeota archaeon]
MDHLMMPSIYPPLLRKNNYTLRQFALRGRHMGTLRDFIDNNRILLWGLLGLLGVFMTAWASTALFYPEKVAANWQRAMERVGPYNWWILILGVLFALVGIGYFWYLARSRKKFNDLIETESKAIYLRNLKELEELAYRLGPKYVDMVKEKGQALGALKKK